VDPTLIERARLGDVDAFERIVRERMDGVYRLSLAIAGEHADAADAAQETFLAAWRQLSRLRDVERFDAWLTRIAVNAARMTIRARGRRRVREIPADELVRSAGDMSIEPAGRADVELLSAALDRLPVDQRALLALHYFEDRPLADIAETLGIPVGTVKSRLYAARQALNRALKAEADV
jgi:RNA polymerase sigma-70 factor (ECF subfamily)